MTSSKPHFGLLARAFVLFLAASWPGPVLRAESACGEPSEGVESAGRPESVTPVSIAITPDLVDQLLAEARTHNPALLAAGARAEAAGMGAASTRQWEDPVANVGVVAPASRGQPASQTGDIVYGFTQMLPLFGRPESMRRVAAANATREQLAADYETQKLRRDIASALQDVAFAGRALEIGEQDLSWLDATLAAVDHRYRVGQSSQVEWLKIQTERAKAADELKTLRLELDHSRTELNRLLNRDLHAFWPKIELPPVQPALAYTPKLVAAALAAEPQLKVMHQETATAQAAADLTRRQRLPTIGVGLEASQYSGDGGIRGGTFTVNFSLPWLNGHRYDSDLHRDRALARASAFDAADYALTLRENLHHAIVDLDAARRQALLYRDDILPLTEQTLASARAAWVANLGLFQDVLDARRMLLDDQLAFARACAEQGRQSADLELLTGTRDFGALLGLADALTAQDDPKNHLSDAK
ncbi:MAG: TolC family protein [Opitutaceae bacterium]|jgi:outer membrane protein TolC